MAMLFAVVLAIAFGVLIVGAMLFSRLAGLLTIFDFFRTIRMEKQVFDMYEDAKQKQRDRRRNR